MQPVAGSHGGLSPAGRVRELLLSSRAVREKPLESRLGSAPNESRSVLPLLRLGATGVGVREVELRDPRAKRGDLERQLLDALRRRRLERQRTQPLSNLLLDVVGTLDLQRDPRELELGSVPAALELPEAGSLLDECAPVLRLRREHLLDLSLTDDRVHGRAEPDVREDLDEIGPAHGRTVHEVLTLGAAHEAACDGDLGEVEVGPRSVLVVEDELDLAVIHGLAIAAAREEDVVGLLGAQLRRSQRAGGPDDRVRDVRLARAVRADDDGHAWLERDLERLRERLEPAYLERPQMHVVAGL